MQRGEDLVDGTAIPLKRPAGAPTSQRQATKSTYGNERPRLLRSEPPLYAIHTKRQKQLVQSPSRDGMESLSVQTTALHSGDTQLHNSLLTESAVPLGQLEHARLSLAGLQGGDLLSLPPSGDRSISNPTLGVSSTCRRAKDIGSPHSQVNFKSAANNSSLLNEAGCSGDAHGVLSRASIATRQQQHPSSGPPTKSLVLRKQPLLVLGNNNNSSSPQSAVVRGTSHTMTGTRTVRRSPTHLASLSPRNRQTTQPAGLPTKPPLLQQPNARGTGRSVFETTLNGQGNVVGSTPKDDHTSHGMSSSGQLANEADLIDVTATLDPDTAERLLGSTQIITGLRQYTGRRHSKDLYGDSTSGRAFALGGGISQSKRVTGSISNSSNTMGGGAGRPSISPRLPNFRTNNDKHFFSLPDSIIEDVSQQQLLGDASPLVVKPNRRTNNFTSQSAQPPLSTFSVSGSTAATPGYDFRVVLSSGKTSGTPIQLSVGSGCVQGMRQTMEDEHFTALNHTNVRDQPVSLLGVLDGHCGRRVAELGAKHLPEFFFSHGALGDNNALALVESILLTDRAIFHALHRSQVSGPGGHRRRSSHLQDMDLMTSPESGGSTLIAAAVHGRMLYVACLGDARAVLYDGNTTLAMSEDHKPSNTKENRRISRCGGFVQFGRVCGVLAVSRALGDFEFKFTSGNSSNSLLGTGGAAASPQSAKFSASKELMVSNVADVRQINLTDESKFLILACDGLWDVLSNEEATQFVKDFLTYTPDINDPGAAEGRKSKPVVSVVNRALNNCAQKLAEFAVDRGSSDNVSVMILFFHDVVDVVTGFNPAPRHQKVRKGAQGRRVSNASHVANPLQRGMPNVEDILHPKVKRR